MVRVHRKSRGWPIGWIILAIILALLVAALFGFRYLGSEQPQKTVELRVKPQVDIAQPIQSAKPIEKAKSVENTKAR
jgi:hypothetical protein